MCSTSDEFPYITSHMSLQFMRTFYCRILRHEHSFHPQSVTFFFKLKSTFDLYHVSCWIGDILIFLSQTFAFSLIFFFFCEESKI